MCVRVCVFVSCMNVCVQLHTDSECYGFGGVVDLVAVGIELGKEVERRTQDGGEEKCDFGGEESHCQRDRSCCAHSLLIISSSISTLGRREFSTKTHVHSEAVLATSGRM
jgi:hypothetical protein